MLIELNNEKWHKNMISIHQKPYERTIIWKKQF